MKEKRIFGLNPNVFFLGVVSFLTDVSSEMVFTLFPLFLLNVLKSATTTIGLIEGIGESTASVLRIASGWFSDRIGKRKSLTILGYSLLQLPNPLCIWLQAGAWCSASVLPIDLGRVSVVGLILLIRK